MKRWPLLMSVHADDTGVLITFHLVYVGTYSQHAVKTKKVTGRPGKTSEEEGLVSSSSCFQSLF